MSLEALSRVPTDGNPTNALVVVLHGWGANAEDVAPLADFLNLPDCQMLMPNAPFPHPYNPVGRMWYGFPQNYNFQGTYNFAGQADLDKSRELLRNWLLGLAGETGVPLERTILAGFSQGGAMTLDVGLSLPLAGLMVLSGYSHARLEPGAQPIPPILMAHGTLDHIVPLSAAHNTRDALLALGAQVYYHELTMGHDIPVPVLDLMRGFVLQVV